MASFLWKVFCKILISLTVPFHNVFYINALQQHFPVTTLVGYYLFLISLCDKIISTFISFDSASLKIQATELRFKETKDIGKTPGHCCPLEESLSSTTFWPLQTNLESLSSHTPF